ncbi:hypothetical protein ACFMPD_12195 [Sedimentitalea sp. HM32M-2]|uniref:hypothetical protein n=1 Tax=Sedimentitalea sp. HM32M-2 TaxID=3351566 RepID=UPI0036351B41
MASDKGFSERIARINTRNQRRAGQTPGQNGDGGGATGRRLPLWIRLGGPALLITALGAMFFLDIADTLPAGVLTADNHLSAMIRARMTEDEIRRMENDPWIEKELKSRDYSDPDLARLLLSN